MKDHYQKQPTKLEKRTNYELALVHSRLDQVSSLLVSIARALIKPEVLAEFRNQDIENNKYVSELNDSLDKLKEKKDADQ